MAQLDKEPPTATVRSSVDDGGSSVISIAGELDISNVPMVEAEFERTLAKSSQVRFDLSRLTFMDSSGIAMLLRAVERTDSVALYKPSPMVKRILTATGLDDVFEIVDA